MKLLLLNFALLFGTTQLFAQQLSKETFVGTWKVIDSQLSTEMEIDLDADGKQKMELMRKGFINTILTFRDNKEFNVEFSETIPDFMRELEFVNNKKWRIEDDRMIAIGTEEDGYSLMRIIVGKIKNKTFFILDESPFLLEVVKL